MSKESSRVPLRGRSAARVRAMSRAAQVAVIASLFLAACGGGGGGTGSAGVTAGSTNGGQPPDTIAPTLASAKPADDAYDVTTTAAVEFTFSEAIAPAGVGANAVAADGSAVEADVQVDGSTVSVTPKGGWPQQQSYTVTIAQATDKAGNPLASPAVVHFHSDAGRFDYPIQIMPEAIIVKASVATDLDGDGAGDLMYTADTAQGTVGLSVRYGSSSAGLSSPVPVPVPGPDCTGPLLRVVDVDGDGRKDIVVGDESFLCGFGILPQTAPRVFGSFVPVGRSVVDIAVADVDGDGLPDIVGADYSMNRVYLWKQQADHAFASLPVTIGNMAYPGLVRLADLNGDGRLDVVLATSADGDDNLAVLEQAADGSFAPPVFLATGRGIAHDIALGDIDGDGRADIVATTGDSNLPSVTVFHLLPGGVMSAASYLPCEVMPVELQLADLDGDGRLDIVVTPDGRGRIGVIGQNADGTLSSESLFLAPPGYFSYYTLTIGDLGGDGRPDIVINSRMMLQRTPDSGPDMLRSPADW